MSVVGIIAEYNPFHNGHKYQIEKIKSMTECDDIVVVMSGNFVQRGVPAILDKYTRAKMAIKNGASLVLEMPVTASTSSAELFAHYGVSLLNCLGNVDYLCFGAENDDIDILSQIADILLNEPMEFQKILAEQLSAGNSFPVARSAAILQCLNSVYTDSEIIKIINSPNNILAIEYLKALKRTKSNIVPLIIKRTDKGYSSLEVSGEYASATSIRNMLETGDYQSVCHYVPSNIYSDLNTGLLKTNMFSDILYSRLLTDRNYTAYSDVSEELANRISNSLSGFDEFESFVQKIHSKNYTDSHNTRALMHILLGITNNVPEWIFDVSNYYLNVLAIKNTNLSILNDIKKKSKIPFVSKFGTFYNSLEYDNSIRKILDINIDSDRLYNYLSKKYCGKTLADDFTINFKDKIV